MGDLDRFLGRVTYIWTVSDLDGFLGDLDWFLGWTTWISFLDG